MPLRYGVFVTLTTSMPGNFSSISRLTSASSVDIGAGAWLAAAGVAAPAADGAGAPVFAALTAAGEAGFASLVCADAATVRHSPTSPANTNNDRFIRDSLK